MLRFLAFCCYVLIEFFVVLWLASMWGWPLVIGLLIASFVLGLVVMKNAGLSAVRSMQQVASDGGAVEDDSVGDAAVMFGCGVFIAVPGFVTTGLGLVALLPPVRRWIRSVVRRSFERAARRRGMSVVTTTVDGVRVTRIVPGDVVAGHVVQPSANADDPSGHSGPSNPSDSPRQNLLLPPDDAGHKDPSSSQRDESDGPDSSRGGT